MVDTHDDFQKEKKDKSNSFSLFDKIGFIFIFLTGVFLVVSILAPDWLNRLLF